MATDIPSMALWASGKIVGRECATVNKEFLLCKKAKGNDPAACLSHGDMVNACTLKVYVQFSGDSFSYRDNLNIYKEKKSKLINRTNSFNTLKAQHG